MVENYYEISIEESDAIRKLKDMHQDIIPVELSLNLKGRLDSVDQKLFALGEEGCVLHQKLNKFESDILTIVGAGKVYAIRYYLEPDIRNNGGVSTQLSEEQLKTLLNNDVAKVFILELYDLVQYTATRQLTYPDWLDQKYIDQIGNKDYSYWHGRLLGDVD